MSDRIIKFSDETIKALAAAILTEQEIRAAVKAARVAETPAAEDLDQAKELIETVSLLTQLAGLQLSN